jgi:hypothetical protein
MRGVATRVERTMSGWLHDDVSITTLKVALVPTPHFKVENLAVGKQLDARATLGRIYVDIGSIFAERPTIRSIELDGVTLSNEAVRRILTWGRVEGKEGEITSIRLRGVKLDVRPSLEPFDANLSFDRKGALTDARLNAPAGWSLTLRPAQEGMDVDLGIRNWTIPVGVPITIANAELKGKLVGNEITIPEFQADALEGKVNGALKASWGSNVRVESNLTLAHVRADQLIGAFTHNIAITGRLDGDFSFASEGSSVENVLASPKVQGKFKLTDGQISNIDLVAAMQSEGGGSRAGVTKFNEITGDYGSVERRSNFRQVSLQGGVLRGNGTFDVAPNNALSGRLAIEIRSQVAQDRGSFAVSGTVSRPILKRGG